MSAKVFPLNEPAYLIFRWLTESVGSERLNRIVDEAIGRQLKECRRHPRQSCFYSRTVTRFIEKNDRWKWTERVLNDLEETLERIVEQSIVASFRPAAGMTANQLAPLNYISDCQPADFGAIAAGRIAGTYFHPTYGFAVQVGEVSTLGNLAVAMLTHLYGSVRFRDLAIAILIELDRFADDKLLPPEERTPEAPTDRSPRRRSK